MTKTRIPPTISDAPGLVWRERKRTGWAARWQARTDILEAGYRPYNVGIWKGEEPNETEREFIAQECRRLQSEMLTWASGGVPVVGQFNGTLASLARCYQTDADSNYRKLQFKTREYYVTLMKRLTDDHGHEELRDIKARTLLRWHSEWTQRGVAAAHAYVGMLRTLFGFGMTFLEDDECERLCGVMHNMRFKMAKPRTERLTAEQAMKVCEQARAMGFYSVALAQAFQFECMLRQKDVIGEFVPVSEPGISDVTWKGDKWLKGIRWEEIDDKLILRHVTSKRQKLVEHNLNLMPMVLEEFKHLLDGRRASGPVIICEITGLPWRAPAFRRTWRMVADAAGIPKAVKNMDSRAGAITEATEAGAELEHIKHAAAHSDISMTQRYARGAAEKSAGVQSKRIEHRNKNGER